MYRISAETKKNIERVIGIPLEQLTNMSVEEERSLVEKRSDSKLVFSKKTRNGIIGRGNPLLSRKKIRTMEDLDKKSKKMFGV